MKSNTVIPPRLCRCLDRRDWQNRIPTSLLPIPSSLAWLSLSPSLWLSHKLVFGMLEVGEAKEGNYCKLEGLHDTSSVSAS